MHGTWEELDGDDLRLDDRSIHIIASLVKVFRRDPRVVWAMRADINS